MALTKALLEVEDRGIFTEKRKIMSFQESAQEGEFVTTTIIIKIKHVPW